jgi:DNA polymerase III subunit beta
MESIDTSGVISVEAEALQKSLALLLKVCERKTSIPVLATVRIDADQDKQQITLTATDLDNVLMCDVSARVERSGVFCVLARTLNDIIGAVDSGSLDMIWDGSKLQIKQGELQYEVFTVSVSSFPETREFEKAPIQINSSALWSLINRTEFAITQEEGRYTLSGVKVMGSEQGFTFIATDDHRLALARANGTAKSSQPIDVLIPRRALSLISKLSCDVQSVQLGISDDHAFVDAGSVRIIARLLSGQFPNYEAVIPKNPTNTVEFDAEETLRAIKQVAIMAEPRSHYIKFFCEPNRLVISAVGCDEGTARQVVRLNGDGKEITVAFNANYLCDFLQRVSGAVIAEITDPEAQVLLRPVSDPDYSYILMPMKL